MQQLSPTMVLAALVCLLPLVFAAEKSCSKVVDFNTYLMPNKKDNFENRIDDVAQAVADTGADVICLQEVWLESSMNTLLSQLSDKYPNHYSFLHFDQENVRKPTSEMGWIEYLKFKVSTFSSCSAKDAIKLTTSLLSCGVKSGCLSEGGSFKCAVDNCADQIKSMNADCISCLGLMGTTGGASGMLAECMPNVLNRLNSMNAPGIMMLSKTPMVDVHYRDFWPGKDMVVKRGYIEAKVPGVGQVVCTHLTPLFDDYFEYDLDLGNFLAQQAAEIAHLKDAFGRSDHLLMGDLNTGPTVESNTAEKNLTGEAPENFQLLMDAGYKSPYLEQDGRCTYCRDNPLTNTSNHVLDHILVMGSGVTLTEVERIIDNVAPLSDHYGSKATVCP